ncbi:PH domain-containing protein [Candidatus Uhrbacteria bacterium]|nr:PH domain-containing protein [Candidatus Uhrbacteria bacterium]
MKSSRSFELKPHEEALATVRQAILPNSPKFMIYIVWLLIPFFFLFPLFRLGIGGVAVFFGLVISGGLLLLRQYIRWSGTHLILTDKRVVDIEQRGFFDRVVTEAPYTQIDEASYRIKGFWATVLRYGSVRFDLSGSAADIQFDHINRPARIHNLVNDLREEHRKEDLAL